MSAGNSVNLVGNATRDPELRFTPSGQAVVNFGIAVNRRWQKKGTEEWEEAVSFFDIVAWGTLGENVAESVQKGDRVMIAGRLDQRSWETDSGDKRSKVEVVADEIAPSLRWATAQVVKNERSNESSGSSGGRSSSKGSSGSSRSNAPAYDDEEPF